MKTKLVWPATLLASFALAAACGGGTTGDGEGGQGGTDGSTGGRDTGGSGGTSVGGLGGQGGLGGGPVIIVPETCGDDLLNEDETDVDCGGPDCDPCQEDAACVVGADCTSGHCVDEVCVAPVCGDSIVNGDEQCDPGRETDDCDEDCTFSDCGDGYLNSRVEECEPDPDLDVWQRCGRTCIIGADLDGTWRTNDVPGTNSPWEVLKANPSVESGYLGGMQTFHYADMPYLYDLTGNQRYDIKQNEWTTLPNPLPYPTIYWENAAVDSKGLWVARTASMHRLDLDTLEWTTPTTDLPDGGNPVTGSGAVYDGDGFIWYVGYDPVGGELGTGEDMLVRYDPNDGTFETFSWVGVYPYLFPEHQADEPRLAYDPLSDKIAVINYADESTLLLFDLASETFAESQPLPDASTASDNCCQDRAGGFYITTQLSHMYRYDIGTDTFEPLPDLPAPDDYGSTCVVSEVGYLYYGTSATDPVTSESTFRRLRLNPR
jgi:hypothetical protein